MNRVSIGSDNGLSPIWSQASIWTNAGSFSVGPIETDSGENFNQNVIFFIHENASENIVCEMAAILSTGRWVNHIKYTSDSLCRPLWDKLSWNQCCINAVFQYSICILKIANNNWKYDTCSETHISECLFDTAYNVSNSQLVDTLKMKLLNIVNFIPAWHNGRHLNDSCCQWMSLTRLCSLFYWSIYDNFIQGFFIWVLVLVGFGNTYIASDACGPWSHSFEPSIG